MTQDTKDILLTLIAAIDDGSIISNNLDYYNMVARIVVTPLPDTEALDTSKEVCK